MAHEENQPPVVRGVAQIEQLMDESFRMAERIISGHMSADWISREAREKYAAFTPLLAMDIKGQLLGLVGIEHASTKQVDDQQHSIGALIAEVKRRNDAADK